MSRFYHVDIARFAARADHKWVDNVLSHFDIPGVEGVRQGLARRITTEGIYHIALVRAISRDAGVSVAAAVTMAGQLLVSSGGTVQLSAGLTLRLDRAGFQQEIDSAIAEAVESLEPRRRGRPPRPRVDNA